MISERENKKSKTKSLLVQTSRRRSAAYLFMAVSISAMAAGWYASGEFHKIREEEEKKIQQALDRKAAAKHHLSLLLSQIRLYREHGQDYDAMVRSGLVGGALRPALADALAQSLYILTGGEGFSMSFSPSIPLSSKKKKKQGGFTTFLGKKLKPKTIFAYNTVEVRGFFFLDDSPVRLSRFISEKVTPYHAIESCSSVLSYRSGGQDRAARDGRLKKMVSTTCTINTIRAFPRKPA